ncbi:MAG: ribonuclease P protein component [Erysipelotrichaceae bacterium]|nr:ribonuclease P protein component [Erysipelotrichaceae bacterium]
MKKQYRVKKNEEFEKIITDGEKAVSRRFVLYYHPAAFDYDRVGISAGKKLGDAVDRVRIRRQVRMMIQEIFDFHSGSDYIVIVRPGYLSGSFADNKNDLSVLYKSVYNSKRTN